MTDRRPKMPDGFTLTEQHLTLLRRMYVGWAEDEYGAPEINPKRPYGNSDVPNDIREVLGYPVYDYDEGPNQPHTLTDEECRALHEETMTALQVFLQNATMEPGAFISEPYRCAFKRESP